MLTAAAAKATNEIGGRAAYPSSGSKTGLSSKLSSLNQGRTIASRHGWVIYNFSIALLRIGDLYITSTGRLTRAWMSKLALIVGITNITYRVGGIQVPVASQQRFDATHDDRGGHIVDPDFVRLEDHVDNVVPELAAVASSGLQGLKKELDFQIRSGP